MTTLLQRISERNGHDTRFGAAYVDESPFANELLGYVLVDLAFGNARIELHDADVQQLLLRYRLGRRNECNRMRNEHFARRAPGQQTERYNQDTEMTHRASSHLLSRQYTLVLVVLVP